MKLNFQNLLKAKPIAKRNLPYFYSIKDIFTASKYGDYKKIDNWSYEVFYKKQDKRYSYFLLDDTIFIPANQGIFIIK